MVDSLNLNEHIDFGSKSGEFIELVSRYRIWWTNRGQTGSISFTKTSLKKVVKYLLENCYFKLGNSIFRQLIEILIVSDPASFFASLFLSHYENKRIKKVKKDDIRGYSGSLMFFLHSTMVESLSRVLKRYVLLNLYSRRKIWATAKDLF